MVKLSVVPGAIFKRQNPIIIGVNVLEGVLNIGTTLFIENIELGVVTDMEYNYQPLLTAINGKKVAISINSDTNIEFFDINQILHD